MVPNIGNLQVVVLMGGLGTRLKGIGSGAPKSMIDVRGRPFFYYQLSLMKACGFRDFVFCIGHGGTKVRKFFKNGRKFGVRIRYSSDGKQLLGTAGALKKASRLLNNEFLLMYGDSFMDIDYNELLYAYRAASRANKKGLLAVFKNNNRLDKSNVVFRNNRLIIYDKKTPSRAMKYIDYGIAILKKNALKGVPADKPSDLADIYRKLSIKRQLAGYEARNRFYEIGRPASLDEFRRFIHARLHVKKKAVILDRDDTLNGLVYNKKEGILDSPLKPQDVKLLPGVIKALDIIRKLGYIIATNQPAAAKGKVALGALYDVNNRLKDMLAKNGIHLEESLLCPHHPEGSRLSRERFLIKKCNCRKPAPGMLKTAIEKFNIDTPRSYMAGDSWRDVLAGRSMNLKTVFIGRYRHAAGIFGPGARPDYIFNDLYSFALYLKQEGR
jgi:histidinol-phosphate phosphatase family protein